MKTFTSLLLVLIMTGTVSAMEDPIEIHGFMAQGFLFLKSRDLQSPAPPFFSGSQRSIGTDRIKILLHRLSTGIPTRQASIIP